MPAGTALPVCFGPRGGSSIIEKVRGTLTEAAAKEKERKEEREGARIDAQMY